MKTPVQYKGYKSLQQVSQSSLWKHFKMKSISVILLFALSTSGCAETAFTVRQTSKWVPSPSSLSWTVIRKFNFTALQRCHRRHFLWWPAWDLLHPTFRKWRIGMSGSLQPNVQRIDWVWLRFAKQWECWEWLGTIWLRPNGRYSLSGGM